MTGPVCPCCNAALPRAPIRKTKCKACGRFIYVKSTPGNRTKRLMTEAQAVDADRQWREHHERSRLDGDMQALGLAPGQGATSARAAIAQLAFDQSADPQRRKIAAFTLSSPRYSPDLESRVRWAMLAATLELEVLRCYGGRSEILAGQNPCPTCAALRGSIWNIDEARRQMPVPNTRCEVFLRGGGCCAYWAAPP